MALSLHGLALCPRDLDLVTTAAGVEEIAARLPEALVAAPRLDTGLELRALSARLRLAGAEIHLLGDPQLRLPAGRFGRPLVIEPAREWMTWHDRRLPLLALHGLARIYRLLQREETAELIDAALAAGR